MDRYLMIEAVADSDGAPKALVSDPWCGNARRFLGVDRKEPQPAGDVSLCKRFVCRAHVVRDHQDIRAAVAAGDLKQHGPMVTAPDADAAEKAIKGAAKPVAKKKDGE